MRFCLLLLLGLIGTCVLGQTRSSKLQQIWAKITANPYTTSTFPGWSGKDISNPINLVKFGAENMDLSFDVASDLMPAGHTKYIHSLGATAQAAFIGDASSPFTGLFKGADSCLARLSLAKNHGDGVYTPGMAFKCFRDGSAASGNFITMFSLDGQKDNGNFFANKFSNIISTPSSAAVKILAKIIFGRASKCPTWISTKDFSDTDQTGAKASSANWPVQMFLEPTSGVQFSSATNREFRADLLTIKAGTKLWDVYGQQFNQPATRVRVGEIVTRSGFVSSQFQDETLFFQHARGESDDCPSGDIKV